MLPITQKEFKEELTKLFNRTFPKYTDQIQLKNIELVKIQLIGFYPANNPRIVFHIKKTYQDQDKPSERIYKDIIHLEEYRWTFTPEEDIPSLYSHIKSAKTIGWIVPNFLLPAREDATDLDALLYIFR